MEEWQERIIRNNLSSLNKKVTCTTSLLSILEERNVLSAEDVDTVQVILKPIEKSYKLLKLLMQKLYGFDIFIGALCHEQVKQYGAAKLLYDERTKYYTQNGISPHPQLARFASSDIPDISVISSLLATAPTSTSSDTLMSLGKSYEAPTQLPKELEDFVRHGTELNVIVKKPSQNDPSRFRYKCQYKLPDKGKGYAFLLNIMEIRGEPIRKGADMDATYMTKLWEGLGYKIFPEDESFREGRFKFHEDITKELQKFKQKCIDDKVDSIVIFIGSHGYNDVILTSDKKKLDIHSDIIYPFQFSISEEKDGKQVEKPVARIFINQSCQSEPPPGTSKDRPFGPPPQVNDSLYVKAQLPKYEAGRDVKCGSYFIIVLAYVFMTKAWNTSLSVMLSEVQDLCRMVSLEAGENAYQLPLSINMGLKEPEHMYFLS